MNIKTLKESLPYAIKTKLPIMLVGHFGIGKTQGVYQFTKEIEGFLRIVNLGALETGDIVGLPDFEKDSKGNSVSTKFMMPDWAKEIIDFCRNNPTKTAILFLDEINRARKDVLQIIFPLLTENRIHTTILPTNLYVMAAMNPNTSDYNVTDMSDRALLDRFCHIKMNPSKQEFFSYAKSKSFDSQIIQFLQDQPELLEAQLEAFDLSDSVSPSRRSWETVDRFMKLKPPMHVAREVVSGLVGSVAATAMFKALSEGDKPISAKDVLENYSKFKKRVGEYSNAKTGGRIDMLKFTCDSILEYAEANKTKTFDKDETKNLKDFLWDIPRELSFSICRELYIPECTRPIIDECKELLNDIAEKRGVPGLKGK